MHDRIKPCCQHKYDGAAYQNAFLYICAIPHCNYGRVYSLTVLVEVGVIRKHSIGVYDYGIYIYSASL